jgi:hypothetical protein
MRPRWATEKRFALLRNAYQRFWALSWWWKGSILGAVLAVIALLAVIMGVVVASGDGGDSLVLEATQEPTFMTTAATPTSTQAPTPIPTPTATPEPPTPTATPVPPTPAPPPPPPPTPAPEPPPPQQQPTQAAPTVVQLITVWVQLHLREDGPIHFGIGTPTVKTRCEYADGGQVTSAVTTISFTPPKWLKRLVTPETSYSWSASNGTIVGNKLTATWTRQIESGAISGGKVTLTIDDGSGGSGNGMGTFATSTCE